MNRDDNSIFKKKKISIDHLFILRGKERNHPEIQICVRICRTPKYYVAIRHNSLAKVFLLRIKNND